LGHWAKKQHGYNPIQPPLLHLEGGVIIEIQPVEKQNRIFDPKQAQEALQKTAFEKEMESQVIVPKARGINKCCSRYKSIQTRAGKRGP
jgi:hypothetical protein